MPSKFYLDFGAKEKDTLARLRKDLTSDKIKGKGSLSGNLEIEVSVSEMGPIHLNSKFGNLISAWKHENGID